MAKDTASALRSATSGASWNVALQIFFRLFTFALNAAVLRYVAPSVLGLANVRLMLLHSTVLLPASLNHGHRWWLAAIHAAMEWFAQYYHDHNEQW